MTQIAQKLTVVNLQVAIYENTVTYQDKKLVIHGLHDLILYSHHNRIVRAKIKRLKTSIGKLLTPQNSNWGSFL